MPWKLIAPLAVIVAALLAATLADRTPRTADLVFINRGEIRTLDPQRMSYLADFRMAYALYEGLVRWNNLDLSIEPAAAESLPEISDHGKTYTFHIREGAKWSNGDPVTAHDFVYSWRRLLLPDSATDYSNLFFVIDGAEEFFRWRSQQLKAVSDGGNRPDPADDIAQIESQFAATVGIRAVDDRTLEMRLKRPTPYLLDLLCLAVAYPVHRPTVEGWIVDSATQNNMRERGWIGVKAPPVSKRQWLNIDPATGRLEQRHGWAKPGTLVCNGPYVLAQWRYKRDVRLERNPMYHNPEQILNDSVLCISVDDNNTAVLAYESGQADWLTDVNAEYVPDMLAERQRYIDHHHSEYESLIASGKSEDDALAALPPPRKGERRNIRALPTFGTDFLQFNCRLRMTDGRANPFAHPGVRRAFALCIDKDEIVRNVTRLNEPVLSSFIPPNSIPNYHPPEGLKFDVQRAREELAATGWKDRDHDGVLENEAGEAFPTIDLLYSTGTPRYQWMMLNLRDQWQSALGVRIELRAADSKFFGDSLQNGRFMISHGRWYGDYSDPTTFLDVFRTGDGNNDRGFSSSRIDALLDQAANEMESSKRMKLLEDCERIIVNDELPLVPMCQLVQVYMYEPGELTGMTFQPRLIQYLWRMRAER